LIIRLLFSLMAAALLMEAQKPTGFDVEELTIAQAHDAIKAGHLTCRFETKDLQTTHGALTLAGFLPNNDAFHVRRVKEAGALVLAKSNMAEMGVQSL
jgi:hypothetical protein